MTVTIRIMMMTMMEESAATVPFNEIFQYKKGRFAKVKPNSKYPELSSSNYLVSTLSTLKRGDEHDTSASLRKYCSTFNIIHQREATAYKKSICCEKFIPILQSRVGGMYG
jgi:hypothetical protein